MPTLLGGRTESQSRLAILSALTALTGVLVGGAIGYLSSRALQDRESEVAARGSARVAQARLLRVADDLSVMVDTRRAFDIRPAISPDLEVDDKRVMASELSAEQWADVLRSESSLRHLESVPVLRDETGTRIDATTCAVLRNRLSQVVDGAGALGDLAQVEIPLERRASYDGARC